MQLYDAYFRKFGVRRIGHLLSPPMPSTRLLDLPQLSIYHYVGATSGLDRAPASNEYMFRNITRPIATEQNLEIGARLGFPQVHKLALAPFVKAFYNHNRRFKQVSEIAPYENSAMTLVVENYGFIPLSYKYQRNVLTEYYKWYNMQAAVWDKVALLAKDSIRNQFLKVNLPQVLPAISDLKQSEIKVNQTSLHHINDPSAWFILEIWKWLDEPDLRAKSLLSKIPADRLGRVNIIFEESGRWIVLNLGLLNTWRMPSEEEVKAGAKPGKDAIDHKQLQRRFLHTLMTLFQARSVDGKDMAGLAGADAKKETGGSTGSSDEATLTSADSTLPKKDPVTGDVKQGTTTETVTLHSDDILNADHGDDNTAGGQHLTPEQERRLEADLVELERISKAVAVKRAEEVVEMEDDSVVEGKAGLTAGAAPTLLKPKITPKPIVKDTVKAPEIHIEGQPLVVDHAAGVKRVVDRLAEQGMLSAAEARRYTELAKKHETIDAPDGKGSLKDFVVIHPDLVKIPESHAIPDKPTILDKTMLKSSLHTFDSHYIDNVLQKDVAAMVMNIQNAGICVTDYEVEHVEQITGAYYMYTIRVVPVEGSPSTLRFKLPSVQNDGVYISNSVPYRLRKQRGDLPIRKIGPDQVGLSSYYGKVFLTRSEKKVNDYGNWLRNSVMAQGLDEGNRVVTNLQPAPVFDNEFPAPRLYTIFADSFRQFNVTPSHWPEPVKFHTLQLNFDHTQREALYGRDQLHRLEKNGAIVVGMTDKKNPVVMASDSSLMVVDGTHLINLPTIEDLLGLDGLKAPDDFAELLVHGDTIPLGIILGYEMGLAKLMEKLGVEPRRVAAGKRVGLLPTEYSLIFSDETLVFEKKDKYAALILAGFNEYHKALRQYSVYEFDKRGVYLNVLESRGLSARHLRELDLLNQLWVDPITRELLIEMGEPHEFQPLLLRSAELLLVDQHPRLLDAAFMRTKGYERLAGAVYTELVKAIRTHNGKPGKSRQPIDLHPFAVWINISEDTSKAQVKDINPIENLKQQEALTYSGNGGRNSRSMTKNTRSYDENDMGVVSESTVDSGDVGVNTYTSADPQFNSVRGTAKRYELGKTGPTALLSTSALLSVGSDRDDPKRVNFIAIQQGHGVSCAGYHANAVRTGYEQVVAHRTSDLFAFTAKKPGKVVGLTEEGLLVEYEDGTKQGFELGRRYGNAEGATIPHEVRASVTLGQKFKVGDLLVFNEGFFEPDVMDPSQVVWKAGVTVRVALMESPLTLEDSSAISKKTADLLRTKTTKPRSIIVDFKQSIRNLVKVGQAVSSEDILCVIEDDTTARHDLFDEESLDTLRLLSAQTPLAKMAGVVERIEVFYHGDKQDMSESLRSVASASDRELSARRKAVGKKVLTGLVDDSHRTDGDPLNLDTLEIKIYITADVAAGVGDKGVFANQMKTVFGTVLENEVTTESGKEIGAIFGAKSIQARIVHSPDIIGTTTTLLSVGAQRVVKAYRGK
jgi:hypothetical protein